MVSLFFCSSCYFFMIAHLSQTNEKFYRMEASRFVEAPIKFKLTKSGMLCVKYAHIQA